MATAEAKQMFEIVFTDQVMGRPFVAPPGVPADRVAALRAGFDRTMKDAAFLAEAAAQKMEIDPVTGIADQRSARARPRRAAGRDRAHPRAGEVRRPHLAVRTAM